MMIPLSYPWLAQKLIGEGKTILDVGCGDGELMRVIKKADWEVTGIDIYPASLAIAKKTGAYTTLIKSEVVSACKKLISQKKKYDIVICSQLIEHLKKPAGLELITLMEKLAKNRVYISTPRGYVDQYEQYLEINPFHKHLSGWTIAEFKNLGYQVYGVGLNFVWSESGLARKNNKFLYVLGNCLSYIFSLPCLLFPELAAGLIATKDPKSS